MEEYTDSRFMSKDFLRGFIDIYKKNIALWKTTCKEYNNRHLKEKGYCELVEYCRDIFPNADKEFVRKRAQNMRGCFRKEYKKVLESQKMGDIYEPKLWYYELFLFTKDIKSDDNDTQSNENEETFVKLESYSDEEFLEECSETAESQSSLVNAPTLPPIPAVNAAIELRKRKLIPIQEDREFKKAHIGSNQNGFFHDEFEAIGVNIAAKLRRMESTQQLLAESLINKVIIKGMFGELSRNNDV